MGIGPAKRSLGPLSLFLTNKDCTQIGTSGCLKYSPVNVPALFYIYKLNFLANLQKEDEDCDKGSDSKKAKVQKVQSVG